jgi:hypothetical protein
MAKRVVKIFIASPSDLAPERGAFRRQIEALNLGFGDGADVEFVLLGWEDAMATTGRRPQSVINDDVDACDVFAGARRLRIHRTARTQRRNSTERSIAGVNLGARQYWSSSKTSRLRPCLTPESNSRRC